MNQVFKELYKKKSEALDIVEKYSRAIKALEQVCEHKWVYEGHGHNDTSYICTECGDREYR